MSKTPKDTIEDLRAIADALEFQLMVANACKVQSISLTADNGEKLLEMCIALIEHYERIEDNEQRETD